jgi:hypothetical protein
VTPCVQSRSCDRCRSPSSHAEQAA